jgi:hypothetical protein
MTKLEELKMDYHAAANAAWLARDDAQAAVDATYDAARDTHEAELNKTQKEENND